MELCLEAKLKITKFTETYGDKSSPDQLTAQYTLDQLDALDCVEEALRSEFHSSSEQLEQLSLKMWRNAMYPQIDYIRRQLTASNDENERRALSQQLDTIILGHLGRLGHLIACFTEGKRELFESGAFLIGEFEEKQRKLLVKLLTFSGDLVRYRSSNNKTFCSFDQFQSSREFYELGHRVDPADGSIFNQLAVIESLSPSKSVPKMIYLYSRALGSREPFPIAKENLTRLLKKFGALFAVLLKVFSGEACVSAEEIENMLGKYPNEEHLLYASYLALSEYCHVKETRLFNPQFSILNNDTCNLDTLTDLDFYSSLIGSSFITDHVQEAILKLFNRNEKQEHESVLLPLSQ